MVPAANLHSSSTSRLNSHSNMRWFLNSKMNNSLLCTKFRTNEHEHPSADYFIPQDVVESVSSIAGASQCKQESQFAADSDRICQLLEVLQRGRSRTRTCWDEHKLSTGIAKVVQLLCKKRRGCYDTYLAIVDQTLMSREAMTAHFITVKKVVLH